VSGAERDYWCRVPRVHVASESTVRPAARQRGCVSPLTCRDSLEPFLQVAQIPASARYFSSSHSSIPYFEPSRPMPDSFIPPNGATSVETKPVLIPMIP
jgi:hypothetical protein